MRFRKRVLRCGLSVSTGQTPMQVGALRRIAQARNVFDLCGNSRDTRKRRS